MTYAGFLLRFIVTANAALWVVRLAARRSGKTGWLARCIARSPWRMTLYFALLAAVILLYTTPWDAALIRRGVWGYAPNRVWGLTIDGVPWEEVLFYLLETALVAQCFDLSTVRWQARSKAQQRSEPHRAARFACWTAFGLASAGAILVFATGTAHLTYFAMLAPWVLLPIAVQASYGMDGIAANQAPIVLSTIASAAYLSWCDSIAIRNGIWFFRPALVTGLRVGDVPLEEIAFFVGSSLMVALSLAVLASQRSRRWLLAAPAARVEDEGVKR
ncbi:lycopene cyclase domain-containing protein [Alicyclobacillus vulcanalis]|uniref:Putative membrane protein n=1 Tax=Alicyclobacillus vulcanalis TaxID=252246 RepID=A0A1N7LI94_9BACL|nr:lycopene cyclase domain-containing protein [Alicyclobacillus vulcanalis]SIS73565.1 putative membrane protein [Alicyclobacillus vulcanalis]